MARDKTVLEQRISNLERQLKDEQAARAELEHRVSGNNVLSSGDRILTAERWQASVLHHMKGAIWWNHWI